jgi:hypothetical protein
MNAKASPGARSLDARHAPSLGWFNLTLLAIEIRRLLRNRRTVVLTLVFPIVLFLLFRSNKRFVAAPGTELTAATTMIGVAVYGAMLAATSGGAMVSIERALGWSRQVRQQLLAQHPARLHEETPIDRLARHLESVRSGVGAGKPARDLLR